LIVETAVDKVKLPLSSG